MPRRVVLSRRAQRWLDDQTDYLLTHNPSATARFTERIRSARAPIADFPRGGRPGPTQGTRRLIAGPYILTYREAGRELLIVIDIRHSRQREAPTIDDPT